MQRYPETVDEFVMAFPNRYRADQPAIDCQVDMVDLKLAIGKTPARLTHRGLTQRRLRGTSESSCTDTQGDKHLKVLTDFALGVISNVRADEAVLRGSHSRAAEPPLAIMDKPRESPHRDADGHPRESPHRDADGHLVGDLDKLRAATKAKVDAAKGIVVAGDDDDDAGESMKAMKCMKAMKKSMKAMKKPAAAAAVPSASAHAKRPAAAAAAASACGEEAQPGGWTRLRRRRLSGQRAGETFFLHKDRHGTLFTSKTEAQDSGYKGK